MKKLTLTLAIVLGMMIGANAQESEYRGERGLFGMGSEAGGWFGGRGVLEELALPDAHGLEDDANASPLGSGLFVLAGLGAAYLVGKKRREE